ncbi:hypothetical protein DWB78_18550 [Halopelagius longus]|uniref:Uncharacterized protein n=1 Tax=Halopelagius longus TaxID=1236180 RepID=A0A370IFR5_9EURY|nr:hypothetical protein DWB78_18550 [Halopelagius longus]
MPSIIILCDENIVICRKKGKLEFEIPVVPPCVIGIQLFQQDREVRLLIKMEDISNVFEPILWSFSRRRALIVAPKDQKTRSIRVLSEAIIP